MKLAELGSLVAYGDSPLGPLWWRETANVEELGEIVRALAPAEVDLFASLHEEAHLWVHRDYDHDAWHLLDVRAPTETGADFAAMKRTAGVAIARLLEPEPGLAVPAKLVTLVETLAILEVEATAKGDAKDIFLAGLVRRAVFDRSRYVSYVSGQELFWIDDLDPTHDHLSEWASLR